MPKQPAEDHDGLIIIEDETLKQGFTQIPNAVLRRPNLSPGAKLAYMGLLSFAWQADSCFPGQETLAEYLGVSRRSIVTYLQDLRDAGLLVVERRGLGRTNVYRLTRLTNARSRSANFALPEVQKTAHQEVQNLHTEEYEEEEYPGEEDTGLITKPDAHLSKSRKGAPTNFEPEGSVEPPKPNRANRSVAGFERVASVLANRTAEAPQPVTRPPQMTTRDLRFADQMSAPTVKNSNTLGPVLAAPDDASAGTTAVIPQPRYSDERALLLAYIRDYAVEFHDQAPLKSSVTRALHIFQRADLPRERWTQMLYEAHSTTKERYSAIRHQGTGPARAGVTALGVVNRMPYFYSVLECVLGLHDHAAGQHPLPLSEAEFKRQQSRGGAVGKRPRKAALAAPGTLAEQGEAPSRKSLAGRYAHLVRH